MSVFWLLCPYDKIRVVIYLIAVFYIVPQFEKYFSISRRSESIAERNEVLHVLDCGNEWCEAMQRAGDVAKW